MKYNYKQSHSILQEIKKAKRILLNVHKNPDLDTIGSSLAMSCALRAMGKDTAIVCPSKIPEDFLFLKGTEKIKTIDFRTFNFRLFDLFIILDTSSYDRVTGDKAVPLPSLPFIVVDHHKTNDLGGRVTLVDEDASATAEMVYRLFSDWGMTIDKNVATLLFSGIAGDTVFFKYNIERPEEIFKTAGDLLAKGADYQGFIASVFDSLDFNNLKLMGMFLQEMQRENHFVWSAIPYESYKKLAFPYGARETVADLFFRSVKGVGFGIAMLETENRKLSISFRSKPHVDVSKIARMLGGGGHKNAAGCTLDGNFKDCVAKVVATARKITG